MQQLSPLAWEIIEARCHDPFAYLGCHPSDDQGVVIRALKPRAEKLWLLSGSDEILIPRIEGTDLFELAWQSGDFDASYRFRIENSEGHTWEEDDVYRFSAFLGDIDLHLSGEGIIMNSIEYWVHMYVNMRKFGA